MKNPKELTINELDEVITAFSSFENSGAMAHLSHTAIAEIYTTWDAYTKEKDSRENRPRLPGLPPMYQGII